MLAVFVALAAEAQCLEPYLAGGQRAQLDGFPIVTGEYAGRPLLLCRTGLGRRAETVARQVIERLPAKGVVSLGFAGALVPQLRAGELLLCEQVYSAEGSADSLGSGQAVRSDPHLLALAQTAAQRHGLPHRRGTSVTVSQVVSSPEDKRELARNWPAHLVEMESFWIGRVAAARGIPFLAVRTVLDELDDPLPDIPGLYSESGTVRPQRAALLALSHPGQLPSLLRLWVKTKRARRSLAQFATAFTSLWEPPR